MPNPASVSWVERGYKTVIGLNSAVTSLGRVIGPLWAGYFHEISTEFPYLSGAAALVLGLLVSMFGLHSQADQ